MSQFVPFLPEMWQQRTEVDQINRKDKWLSHRITSVFVCVKENVSKSRERQSVCLTPFLASQRYIVKDSSQSSFFPKQNSVAVFRELCGVSVVSNLMQCVLALGARVSGPDGTPLLLFDLRDNYPTLEPQGPLPDVLRRVVSTYDMVSVERSSWLICSSCFTR